MKYFNTTITNSGKEIDYVKAFVAAIKNVLGSRVTLIEQEGKEYIQGNVTPPTSIASGYGFDLILDNKLTISFTRSGTSGINGYRIQIPLLDSTNYTSVYWSPTSSSQGWNVSGTRSQTIKGIQTDNLLIFSIIANAGYTSNAKSSFTFIILQNTDTYSACTVKRSVGDIPSTPLSNMFTTSLIFQEISGLDTLSGNSFTLVNRFPYNYNTDFTSKEVEIRQGKVAVLQNTTNKVTIFNDLFDSSIITEGLFMTLNNQRYYTLNQHTLVNIEDTT